MLALEGPGFERHPQAQPQQMPSNGPTATSVVNTPPRPTKHVPWWMSFCGSRITCYVCLRPILPGRWPSRTPDKDGSSKQKSLDHGTYGVKLIGANQSPNPDAFAVVHILQVGFAINKTTSNLRPVTFEVAVAISGLAQRKT